MTGKITFYSQISPEFLKLLWTPAFSLGFLNALPSFLSIVPGDIFGSDPKFRAFPTECLRSPTNAFIPSGIFFVLPCIESYQKVDLRTITLGVPPQEVRLGRR